MIFIEGNFPSFKNSKQRTSSGLMIMSKTVRKYLKDYEFQWEVIPKEFKNITKYPILVGFHFIRGTKHRWDFHNMVQGCADLMVKYKWIPDDNMDYFIPSVLYVEDRHYSYDKDKPGVIIKIINK